jgi:hypothetical protein
MMITKMTMMKTDSKISIMTKKQIIIINNYYKNNQHDHDEADPSPLPSLSPSRLTTLSIRMTLPAAPPPPPAATAGGALVNHTCCARGHGALEDNRSPGLRPHNARRQMAAAAAPRPHPA